MKRIVVPRWIPVVGCIGAVFLLTGCSHFFGHYLAFATATKFGVDMSQRPDQTVDVVMGYQRLEMASIPVPDGKDASKTEDA